MRIPLLVYVVFSSLLIFCASSRAQTGTSAEVIQAAESGHEPAYIGKLTTELSKKLNGLGLLYGVEATPRERLAWALMVRALIYVSWEIALNAALDVNKTRSKYLSVRSAAIGLAPKTVYNIALNVAFDLCHSRISKAALNVEGNTAKNIAWNAAYNITNEAKAKGALLENLEGISFRAAEWALLNYFVRNIDSIAGEIYLWTLSCLPQGQQHNLMDNLQSLIPIFERPTVAIDSSLVSYLISYFPQLVPFDWVLEGERARFRQCNVF